MNKKQRDYNDTEFRNIVKRGDIWEIRLKGVEDEQKENRYCVIVSNDIANRYTDKVTIVPLTTTFNLDKRVPTHVDINHNGRDARVKTELVKTLPRKRLILWDGRVTAEQLKEIELALQMHLGIVYIPRRDEQV